MKVLVTGGYFDDSGECFVDEVDFHRGESRRIIQYRPDDSRQVARKGFTGAVWADPATFLVCSFNAVHRYDPRTWRETGRLQQNDFNDLHHVTVDAMGTIYVCNTGLDAVEVFDGAGCFMGRHGTSPAWFERARVEGWAVERRQYEGIRRVGWHPEPSPVKWVTTDDEYYQGRDPRGFHCSITRDYEHPNHVTVVDGHLAVTMLATRVVCCLRTFRTLVETEGHPHDGQADGDRFWTTEVDGRITAWGRRRNGPWTDVAERYDVRESGVTGWCRGLLIAPESVVVGFTAVRGKPQYRWNGGPFESTSTVVIMLERGTGRLMGRVDIGEPGRHAKVFSILEAEP